MNRRSFPGFARAAALICLLQPLWAQEVLITEIQAVGSGGLLDEDKDLSNWIELFNSGQSPVNLAGYALTDKPDKTAKWKFPEVTLPPRGFLLVYASEKNRTNPAAPLHTNFKLHNPGEYLALLLPDGTVVSELSPKYPPQVDHASYGLAMDATTHLLVGAEAEVLALVPASDSLGLTWTAPEFDDASWTGAIVPVGYDRRTAGATYDPLLGFDIEAEMYRINASVYMRMTFEVPAGVRIDNLRLRIQYEDAFVAYLNGQEVARRNTPPNPGWNSAAATRRVEAAALAGEDISLTAHAPLLKEGRNVLAIHGLNDNKNGATFFIAPQLEAITINEVKKGTYFYIPTPTAEWSNVAGAKGLAPEPIFSVPAGAYADNQSVEITTASPTATMRYTIDRSDPRENSRQYAGPIPITNTTVVRAKVFEEGYVPSAIASQTYFLLQPDVVDFNSNLPLLVLHTFGRTTLPEDPLVSVQAALFDTFDGKSTLTQPPDYIGNSGMKKRGSSSLSFPKNNYNFEVWDESNRDLKVSLLGMPPESDWTLHGPYSDKTQMRNFLSYDWSNRMGRYAVRCRLVEVFFNLRGGKVSYADYYGVYVLMEKIKRGKDRVNISRLHASENQEPALTGGYILKIDRLDPGDSGFTSSRGLTHAFVEPKEQEITPQQKIYIKRNVDQFEGALFGANFANPDTGYAKFIDVDSFIDHHMLVEITKNIDGFRLSTFMFKDRNGKLNMGPIWDYNLSLGNADYLGGWEPRGWYMNEPGVSFPHWQRLFQDPNFVKRYGERWFGLRTDLFKAGNLLQQIDETAAVLKEPAARNFKRWPTLGTYVWPNKFIGKTYDEEIGFMKGWVRDRVAWIDTVFIPAPTFDRDPGPVAQGTLLGIRAPSGSIVYTVNGPDPRLAEGDQAAEALAYAGPIPLNANSRVRARVKREGAWSALVEGTFVVSTPPLVVTEVMFNPAPPPAGSIYRSDDFEFVELQNIGTEPISMDGVQLTDAVKFTFPIGAVPPVPPGGHVLVVRKRDAFATRYAADRMAIAGEYNPTLGNSSGTVGVRGAVDEPITRFRYLGAWYPQAAGQGHSIVPVDPRAAQETLSQKEAWRPSTAPGGSPGESDGPVPQHRQLPGDYNQDSKLNISDVIDLLGFLFLHAPLPLPCQGGIAAGSGNQALLDMNGSRSVTITDAVYLLNYVFREGPSPVAGRECVEMSGCPDACVR